MYNYIRTIKISIKNITMLFIHYLYYNWIYYGNSNYIKHKLYILYFLKAIYVLKYYYNEQLVLWLLSKNARLNNMYIHNVTNIAYRLSWIQFVLWCPETSC